MSSSRYMAQRTVEVVRAPTWPAKPSSALENRRSQLPVASHRTSKPPGDAHAARRQRRPRVPPYGRRRSRAGRGCRVRSRLQRAALDRSVPARSRSGLSHGDARVWPSQHVALPAHSRHALRTRSPICSMQDGIVLWFQGRMEYGPRALGHRSVIARPDRSALRDRLNRALKRRAWFQPFCPSLLESEAPRLFADWDGPSNPHMTMVYMVKPAHRDRMAGVIGPDGSCRPQIVPEDAAGSFPRLLHQMRARLGSGVVLNTSFNVHGEPLVCTPDDAVDVYLRSGADALALGPFLVVR